MGFTRRLAPLGYLAGVLRLREPFRSHEARMNSFAAPADTNVLYLDVTIGLGARMVTGVVYYCWSCDGHCRASVDLDQTPSCPRCGKPLTEDCRVSNTTSAPTNSLIAGLVPPPTHSNGRLAAA